MKLSFKHASLLASLSIALLPGLVQAAKYDIVKEYAGENFFDGWDFYGNADILMNGDVEFITAAEAKGPDSLAYVDPNTSHAIIKVDNATGLPWPEKRKSVRITSQESYGVGSVIIADIHHAPYGCSVWPSFWTWAAAEEWPAGGEIDIFEGINRAGRSQMGLHTPPGCSQVNAKQTTTEVRTTDCAGENNSGCIVANTDSASYGDAFNNADGGVFITEFAEEGISIWFFSRANIPAGITPTAKTVDTAALGTPMGNWPSGGCDINKFFKPQNIVFTITLCGDFARPPQIFAATGCTGDCYTDWVFEPSNYDDAYFDVASVRVFSDSPPSSSAVGSSSATGAASTSSSATGTASDGGATGAPGGDVEGGGSVGVLSKGVARWSVAVAAAIGSVML